MNMKSFVGTLIAITVISLNTIPTENSTKMVIENETIYESDEVIAEIKDEIEDEAAESNTSIPEESKSEIKPIKKPSKNQISNPENHTENEPENVNPDSNPPQGKAYVEGFGYVEIGGPTQVITGYSDGDINKQVGIMD